MINIPSTKKFNDCIRRERKTLRERERERKGERKIKKDTTFLSNHFEPSFAKIY